MEQLYNTYKPTYLHFASGRFLLRLLVITFILFNFHETTSQIDTLTNDVLESIYKEEPSRIKNDSLKKSTFNAYPYVFYTPESQLAFGAGGVYIFYADSSEEAKPSKIGFGGYYSTNNQYKLSISPNIYLFKNRLYIEAPTSFGYFVNKYWGIGDDVPDYDDAAYGMQTFATTITIQVPPVLFAADRTGVIFDFDQTEIVDKKDNELLEDENLPGVDGGTLIGIGTDLVWDSRDNLFFPNSGGYQYFRVIFYPGQGDFIYASFQLDMRAYRAISPDHVFAFNFFVESVVGETPFYKLPALGGGSRMRGFFNGRYRDNFYGMVQAEYRQYVWKKFGVAVFGGVGNVAEDILAYDFGTLKYSGGFGLRYKFNAEQKINLRMDLALGSDGSTGIYFGIQEAF